MDGIYWGWYGSVLVNDIVFSLYGKYHMCTISCSVLYSVNLLFTVERGSWMLGRERGSAGSAGFRWVPLGSAMARCSANGPAEVHVTSVT